MVAFYRSKKTEMVYKVYSDGDDWHCRCGNKSGWFSKWSHDVLGSLLNAISAFSGENVSVNDIEVIV